MKLFKNFINGYYRLIAKQLRSPSGLLAKYVGNTMNKSNEELYELTLNNLDIKDGDSILEIGFGNGRFFSGLNAKAANLSIVGIDHSLEMVNEAIKNNKDLYQNGNIQLSAGSSTCLPYESNSFDKVFCINVIYFWDNPTLHLNEIQRVLKPGGVFCSAFRPKDNLAKFPFSKYDFTLYSEEGWKNIIETHGFQFLSSQHSKDLVSSAHQKNSTFESLCLVSVKE